MALPRSSEPRSAGSRQSSPWNVTYVADLVCRRLDDLDEQTIQALNAVARSHPGRWRFALRRVVDDADARIRARRRPPARRHRRSIRHRSTPRLRQASTEASRRIGFGAPIVQTVGRPRHGRRPGSGGDPDRRQRGLRLELSTEGPRTPLFSADAARDVQHSRSSPRGTVARHGPRRCPQLAEPDRVFPSTRDRRGVRRRPVARIPPSRIRPDLARYRSW